MIIEIRRNLQKFVEICRNLQKFVEISGNLWLETLENIELRKNL